MPIGVLSSYNTLHIIPGFCSCIEDNLGFHPSFSRHGRAQASLTLIM